MRSEVASERACSRGGPWGSVASAARRLGRVRPTNLFGLPWGESDPSNLRRIWPRGRRPIPVVSDAQSIVGPDLQGSKPDCMLRADSFGRVLADPLIGSVFFFRRSILKSPWWGDPQRAPVRPMSIAHVKVTGLDQARLVALVEPVLLAHDVDAVELIWKTDTAGWILSLTVERKGAKLPGEGATLELCADLSRDLSRVLDQEDLISNAYRLEVGSPGLERALYTRDDFGRFEGWLAKAKLNRPIGDLNLVRGKIVGLGVDDNVVFETETGTVSVPYETIEASRLVFDWNNPHVLGGAKAKSPKSRSSERDRRNRASKRKR